MQLNGLQRELVDSLIWYVGEQVDREIQVRWNVRGHPTEIDDNQEVAKRFSELTETILMELSKIGLLEYGRVPTEYGSQPYGGKFTARGYTWVKLLPSILKYSTNEPVSTLPDARHANVQIDLYELKKIIEARIQLQELSDIIFKLGFEYNHIIPANSTLPIAVENLLKHAKQKNKLLRLWQEVLERLPYTKWDTVFVDKGN